MKVVQLELQLDRVESQIQKLLAQNETNWKETAKLAITVQDKQLYQPGFKSFTAWVNHIATKCDRHPSLIWRYIKAAKYYLHTVDSDDIELLSGVKAPPEALEKLEKIERNAPGPVFEKLKEKVLAGEATVSECRQIEQEYRPDDEQHRRGRPAKGKEGSYQHLGRVEPEAAADAIEIIPGEVKDLPRNQVAATISRSLKFNLVNWTSICAGMQYPPRNYKEHTEVRINVSGERRRLDFLAVVRWSLKRPKDLFAVEIKSCLSDFQTDRKWQEYLDFCHYFCFAIPDRDLELASAIASFVPSTVGILGIDLSAEIQADLTYPVRVIRAPTRLEATLVSKVYETLYERILGWSGSDEVFLGEGEERN